MTDRDRLIELISGLPFSAEYEKYNSLEFAEHLADYLLANGVIVPPCKVRDRLYAIFNNKIVKGIAKSLEIVIEENKISYIVGLQFFKGIMMIKGFSFGKNIFLTKEKAEKVLKESENNA